MYDYTKMEQFKIENVEHDIHILGVTPAAAVYAIGVYSFTLPLSPIFSIFAVATHLLISRNFFIASEKGEPIEYDERFLSRLRRIPFLMTFFSFDKITFSQGRYRG